MNVLFTLTLLVPPTGLEEEPCSVVELATAGGSSVQYFPMV